MIPGYAAYHEKALRVVLSCVIAVAVPIFVVSAGKLKVNLTPFKYSAGVSSNEYSKYVSQQGAMLGQPHCTYANAGAIRRFCIFLIPKNISNQALLSKHLEGTRSFLELFGQDTDVYAFLASDQNLPVQPGNPDILKALKDNGIVKIQLNEGLNSISIPNDYYCVFYSVSFEEGVFQYPWSCYWQNSLRGEGLYGNETYTYYPINWGPNEIVVNGDTAIAVYPHAYNLQGSSALLKSFIEEKILGSD